ncbi:MAG: DUF4214 domain-containing protein [Desulfobacterales bacterium]|nr:MAG: DUF4214 domain-containing protein [Desulfobacterales bacterium]
MKNTIRILMIALFGCCLLSGNASAYETGSAVLVSKTGDSPDVVFLAKGSKDLDANTIETVIRHYYNRILDREPDESGIAGWQADIVRTASLRIDVKEGFVALAKVFFTSTEYTLQGKNDASYVTDLYQTFLNRTPASTEVDAWVAFLDQGLSRMVLFNSFAFSEEFMLHMANLFGEDQSLSECNLVNDLYRGLLGRLPDSDGLNGWVALMQAAVASGDDAVRQLVHEIAQGFLQSAEYQLQNKSDRGFLEDLYNGILRRGADTVEFDAWIEKMNQGLSREDVLEEFIKSAEFQLRVEAVLAGMSYLYAADFARSALQSVEVFNLLSSSPFISSSAFSSKSVSSNDLGPKRTKQGAALIPPVFSQIRPRDVAAKGEYPQQSVACVDGGTLTYRVTWDGPDEVTDASAITDIRMFMNYNSCRDTGMFLNGGVQIYLSDLESFDGVTISISNFNWRDEIQGHDVTYSNFTMAFNMNGDAMSAAFNGSIAGTMDLGDGNGSQAVNTEFINFVVGATDLGGQAQISIDGGLRTNCGGLVQIVTVSPLTYALASGSCPSGGEFALAAGDHNYRIAFGQGADQQGVILYAGQEVLATYDACGEISGLRCK